VWITVSFLHALAVSVIMCILEGVLASIPGAYGRNKAGAGFVCKFFGTLNFFVVYVYFKQTEKRRVPISFL